MPRLNLAAKLGSLAYTDRHDDTRRRHQERPDRHPDHGPRPGVPRGIRTRCSSELRDAEPVHYDAIVKRWVLSAHDDIEAVLKDKALWAADARKAIPGTYMALFAPRDGREPSILMIDDPDHGRLRGLVNKAFTPRAVEKLAPRIQEIVDGLLDAVEGRESFDLIGEFSGPLPTIVIAEMLGIDPADQADFKRWSDALGAGFDPAPTPEKATEAHGGQ